MVQQVQINIPSLGLVDELLARGWLAGRRLRQWLRNRRRTPQLNRLAAQLNRQHELDRQGRGRVFVFSPGISWQRQLFQRPQQLALALGSQGQMVYYLEPDPEPGAEMITPVGEGVWLVNAPPQALRFLADPILYLLPWSDSPARHFAAPRLLYDIVDDFSVFNIQRSLLLYQHRQRMSQAEAVLVTAQRLLEEFRPQRSDLMLCPNGVDYAHFHRAVSNTPADLAPLLARGQPIVGYYGALAEWVDYRLLGSVAQTRQDVQFVLIGPAHDGSLEASGVLGLENIHWLGKKPYADLPDYLHAFDLAMIPFKVIPLTNATSPIKLFEYFAGGKPVISTPIAECLAMEGVLKAASAAEFSAQLDLGLSKKGDPFYLEQIDRIARQSTWSERSRQILDTLD